MKWIKKGLIYAPDKEKWWSQHYGILPTPEYIPKENKIRIYYSSADRDRNGRIFFLDVDANNPSIVLSKRDKQVLDIGRSGNFDDCGVNPSSIIHVGSKTYLYYVGYQRCQKVPYMLFPGLAIGNSRDKFRRYSNAPVIDRSRKHYISHAAPFVLFANNKFKMWLWLGKKWVTVNSKLYIRAEIGYAESDNGINWSIKNSSVIKLEGKKEFSVGRPWVIFDNNLYKMWYSIRYVDKLYRIGYAVSKDGIIWKRKDKEAGIDVSEKGWDSEMICYPAVIKVKRKTYMFYNGNNNGEAGFGYAVLKDK
jgi:predicted GH43/DUF377 family glycosyl hydrolase